MSTEIITLPSTTEIANLPRFTEALAKLEAIHGELATIEREAREIKVQDAASFKRAGELTARQKQLLKDAEDLVNPYKSPLRKWLDFVQQHFNTVKNRIEAIRGPLDAKMGDYTRKEREAADEETRRAQQAKREQLEREAQEKRERDEEAAKEAKKRRVDQIRQDLKKKKITLRESKKLLSEAGALEEAALAQAAIDEEDRKAAAVSEAAAVKVEANIPSVTGVVKRMKRSFRVLNPQKVNVRYLMPDESAIGKVVRNQDLTLAQIIAEIGPGSIEIKEEEGF
jgi:Fe-S cluster assembly scaffold protein SufB